MTHPYTHVAIDLDNLEICEKFKNQEEAENWVIRHNNKIINNGGEPSLHIFPIAIRLCDRDVKINEQYMEYELYENTISGNIFAIDGLYLSELADEVCIVYDPIEGNKICLLESWTCDEFGRCLIN